MLKVKNQEGKEIIINKTEYDSIEDLLYDIGYVEYNNTINLSNLNFNKFKCNVRIDDMKVNGNLNQSRQVVSKSISQYDLVFGDKLLTQKYIPSTMYKKEDIDFDIFKRDLN